MATVKIEKLLDYVYDLGKETEFKRNQELLVQSNIKKGLEESCREYRTKIKELEAEGYELRKAVQERDTHIAELVVRNREIE